VGDPVAQDEEVASIETDKVDIPINSPVSGVIRELLVKEEDSVVVGQDLLKIEEGAQPDSADAPKPKSQEQAQPKHEEQPAPEPKVEEKAPSPAASHPQPQQQPQQQATPKQSKPAPVESTPTHPVSTTPKLGTRGEHKVKLNRMRKRIAERLKQSQNTAASLTTFNEIDMTNLIDLRKTFKDEILSKHGIKFGYMSAFTKASALALQAIPEVNAFIDGDHIVYHDYCDISVAVATPKGLVTPVIRNVESMSLVEIEREIASLGKKARDNKITIEDLAGGTFTISNGGVFGSLYGTPIINMPQSAILGMHAIKERPVAVNGKIEIRPMMYVALSYDHRIIDGREAVTFLIKVKEAIEDPRRMLLDI
ncbi:2-oxoglutarate dehydrogenase complex E2 component, partial [Spiromyces aspiralis]